MALQVETGSAVNPRRHPIRRPPNGWATSWPSVVVPGCRGVTGRTGGSRRRRSRPGVLGARAVGDGARLHTGLVAGGLRADAGGPPLPGLSGTGPGASHSPAPHQPFCGRERPCSSRTAVVAAVRPYLAQRLQKPVLALSPVGIDQGVAPGVDAAHHRAHAASGLTASGTRSDQRQPGGSSSPTRSTKWGMPHGSSAQRRSSGWGPSRNTVRSGSSITSGGRR